MERCDGDGRRFRGCWLRTGDASHRDAAGFFYADDRLKAMVISGGENIHPAELENVLGGCPAILDAAAFGPSDERWGEVPITYVVARFRSSLRVACVTALFEGPSRASRIRARAAS